MNKYHILGPLILASALLTSTIVKAQEAVRVKGQAAAVAPGRQDEGEDTPVFDDDGGRVFIVARGQDREVSSLRFHGGEVISQPRQVSIFLGSGWSKPETRSRETRLTGILAGLDRSAEEAELTKRGVTTLGSSPLQYEEQWQFDQQADPEQSLSDLQIQQILSTLLETGRIASPDNETVYAVFLAPELKSTLGGLLGRKHYLAYHNFFHVEGGQVRYIVVPFEANRKASRSIATQALIQAILNPTGNGWY